MNQIEIKNLYKIFGPKPKSVVPLVKSGLSKKEILKKTGCTVGLGGISFSVNEGEIFVVMGLSGSGKSTMIRCLNRLIDPTAGQVLVDGEDVVSMTKKQLMEFRRKKMSMVFQHFGLLPNRDVLANVEFGLEVSGVEKSIREEKAREAIRLVGLEGYEKSWPRQLSGGMQQRVGLARAVANEPEILLMDEAFSALDPIIRVQMQDELLSLQEKMHKTIVFITHDLDEALKMGNRIAIMGDGGTIHQIGTPEKILCEPADDFVKKFVHSVDRKSIVKVSSVMRNCESVSINNAGPLTALHFMEEKNIDYVFVTGANRKFAGLVTLEDCAHLAGKNVETLTSILKENVYTTTTETSVSDILGTVLSSKYAIAVIDENRKLLGIVDRAKVIAEVKEGIDDEASPTLLTDLNGGAK